MSMRIEVFEGKSGWFWHFRASNGRITAVAESFTSKSHAMRAAKSVVRGVVNLWPGKPVWFNATPSPDGKRTILRWS